MIVREARESDLEEIKNIWNYYITKTLYNYDYEAKSDDFMIQWFQEKQSKAQAVLVIEKDGEMLGYGTFAQFRPHTGYLHSAEHGIYLKPDLIGKGIGLTLYQELEKRAKQSGYHTLIGGIDSTNESSIKFHLRNGFKEVAKLSKIGFKNGQWLDCLFLQKMI